MVTELLLPAPYIGVRWYNSQAIKPCLGDITPYGLCLQTLLSDFAQHLARLGVKSGAVSVYPLLGDPRTIDLSSSWQFSRTIYCAIALLHRPLWKFLPLSQQDMSYKPNPEFNIVIVGAGCVFPFLCSSSGLKYAQTHSFGGIAAAIALKTKWGFDNFVVRPCTLLPHKELKGTPCRSTSAEPKSEERGE